MKRLCLLLVVMVFGSWMNVASVHAEGFQHVLREVPLVAGQEVTMQAPFAFEVFAIRDVEGVQVRFHDRRGWGEWRALSYEEAGVEGSALQFVESSDALMLRSNQTLETEVTLMSVGDGGVEVASLEPVAFATSTSPVQIISRRQWGADESIGTYDPNAPSDDDDDDSPPVNTCAPIERAYPGQYQLQGRTDYLDELGRHLIWPRTYSSNVKKIVIHHTAQDIRDLDGNGRVDVTDYRLGVKAIHTFHTLTRGWGDIGYHYLVDPDGNIYEGRAGGKDVIAAHVLCQNSNTVGVAVMGNFEEDRLNKAGFDGLVKIVKYLTELYQINPMGKSVFRGTELPHIVTHGEVGAVTKSFVGSGATSCPGNHLVKMMSRLRSEVANGGLVAQYSYALLDSSGTTTVKPLEEFELFVTLKNAGQQTWREVSLSTRGRNPVTVEVSPVFVGPGQELKIAIPLQAGLLGGRVPLTFDVSIDGHRQQRRIPLIYSVRQPVYAYELLSFEGSTDPLLIGQSRDLSLRLKNTSNFTWYQEGDYQLKIQQVDLVRGRTVVTRRGLSLELSKDVAEGEVVMVPIELPAQRRRGDFQLTLIPMIGRDKGLDGAPISLDIPVEMPNFAVEVYPATLSQRVTKGFEESVDLSVVNKGNYVWETGTVWVEVAGDDRHLIPIEVPVGERYVFPAKVKAGYDDSQLKVTGKVGIETAPSFLEARRFRKETQPFTVSVRATGAVRLSAEYVGQSRREVPTEKDVYTEWVDLKNTSTVPWYASGPDQIVLEGPERGNFRHRTWRRGVQAGFLTREVVMPGEVGRFELKLQVRRSSRYAMSDVFRLAVGDQKIRTSGGAIRFATPGIEREERVPIEEEGPIQEISSVPPMRVWLTDVDQDEVQITSPGAFVVWDSRSVQIQEKRANEVMTIRTADLQGGTIYRLRAIDAPYLQFRNWDRVQSFGVGVNDNTFRDVLEFRLVDGQLTAINELPLEHYMKGIAEVPESNDQPQDKRKVIAVLARSYALHYLIGGYEKFPGKPYNAADSPAIFQKYLGYNFEQRSPKWQQAITETAQEVVMVNTNIVQNLSDAERVLRAAYFSCTDGTSTKSGMEVWPTNPYFQVFSVVFQSVPDPLGDDPNREGLIACGHQVGLSGYGATQKASAGWTYREIIESYYQHVSVDAYLP